MECTATAADHYKLYCRRQQRDFQGHLICSSDAYSELLRIQALSARHVHVHFAMLVVIVTCADAL